MCDFSHRGGVSVCVSVCVCVYLSGATRWHILMNSHQQLVLDDTRLGTKKKRAQRQVPISA